MKSLLFATQHSLERTLRAAKHLPGSLSALLLSALLIGCAVQAPPSGAAPKLHEVRYLCAAGVVLEVSYLQAPTGESFASFPYQGHTAVLESRPSASGVRYVDQNEQQGLRWNTKGEEGFLSRLAPDHTATEQTLLSGCRATPAR